MFGIIQSDIGAIRFIPQAGVAIGVEHLHFLARFLQRRRSAAVGPAAEESRPRPCALTPACRPKDVLEPRGTSG